MALATNPPFRQYTGTDGQPLNGGSIFFGISNQNPETAPVTVYWDAAATQPAAQPVKTLNGYPARNGNIAQVFATGDYSITVRDINGVMMYTAAQASVFDAGSQLSSDLASKTDAAKGSGLSGHGGNLNYVAGTIGAVLNDICINPKMFPWLATGNGTTDDTAAIQAALDYLATKTTDGASIDFGASDYLVSALSATRRVRFTGKGATIKASTTTGDVLSLSAGASLSTIEGIKFDCASNRTAGAYLKLTGTFWVTIRDCSFWRYYTGIHGAGAVSIGVDNCQFEQGTPATTSSGGAGIKLDTALNTDWRLSNLIMDTNAGEPSYGIKAVWTDALTITSCDIINHGSTLAMLPGTGEAVAATFVTNSYFDNSVTGVEINPTGTGVINRAEFTGCWYGSNSFHNIYINQSGSTTILGLAFTGGKSVLSGGNGLVTQGAVTGLTVNGLQAGGNVGSGIALSGGTTGIISNCHLGLGPHTTANAFGLFLSTPTGDLLVENNIIKGNGTASIGGVVGTARIGQSNITAISNVVASAASITLPIGKRLVSVTGTNNIGTIVPSYADDERVLVFNAALTVTDGSNLVLAGNFVTAANSTLTLICDGVTWFEASRSVN